MKVYENVLELIGHTPLVKLQRMVDDTMATVLVKMEQLNPGGSVKDRMAYHIIRRAEERGLIKPGATLVESTSGNTGMGLAIAAAVLGYRCVFAMPDKMSKEKVCMLKAVGAEVIITRTDLEHDHPESYVEVAKRVARETPNAFYTDQYYNMDNPEAHYLTTGPEIWEDTDGSIDCLVGGLGTGGTISGAGKYLREKAAEAGRSIQIICPDPYGSIYYDKFNNQEPSPPKIYRVEGIGHDFMVGTLDFSVIDEVRQVHDRDSFLTARRLLREEGILTGGSSGTAVFGALEVARELGPGKLVVCILPDAADRYMSKCFDDEWMKDLGYLGPEERLGTVGDLVQYKVQQVQVAAEDETIGHVAERMRALGISQMPIPPNNGRSHLMIHESDILQALVEGAASPTDKVMAVAKELQGQVTLTDSLAKVQRIFDDQNVAVVIDGDRITNVITKIDMVEFLAAKS